METQSFKNHVRVHPLYHYVLMPFSLLLVLAAGINGTINYDIEAVILLMITVILHLVVFVARDYAKKNQDRIIRSELRLRYFQLTHKRLDEIESEFAFPQLLALRFASDDEFLKLIESPETRERKPVEIKKQITRWNADWMRI